jgi:hypothetical protein
MLAIDSKNTKAISTIGDTLSAMKLLEDLPSALSSEGTASKQGSPNCLDGDSVNTSGSPTTVSAKGAHRRIPTTGPGRMESTLTQPLCGSQGIGDQPVAVEAEECGVEALLAKWNGGQYLVEWKGFPDGPNWWVKKKDIDRALVEAFDATYQGNHLGVQLLKKRVRKRTVEYFVKWTGRPDEENSWVKEATISRERIMEFEARGK